MENLKGMTKEQLLAHIQVLEAKQQTAEPGRIWPDVSKKVKEGTEPSCPIVLRGVNANPRQTVNLYPSQLARLANQLPEIVRSVLDGEISGTKTKLWSKFGFRSEDEREATRAILEAYVLEHK